jgi:hypothetical protein
MFQGFTTDINLLVPIISRFSMSQPTAQEQQMLELVNRLRQAPAAKLNILGETLSSLAPQRDYER